MKYLIVETHEIIEAFTTTTYEIEAESEDEAIEMIDNHEVDSLGYDIDVRDTELMKREIKEIIEILNSQGL